MRVCVHFPLIPASQPEHVLYCSRPYCSTSVKIMKGQIYLIVQPQVHLLHYVLFYLSPPPPLSPPPTFYICTHPHTSPFLAWSVEPITVTMAASWGVGAKHLSLAVRCILITIIWRYVSTGPTCMCLLVLHVCIHWSYTYVCIGPIRMCSLALHGPISICLLVLHVCVHWPSYDCLVWTNDWTHRTVVYLMRLRQSCTLPTCTRKTTQMESVCGHHVMLATYCKVVQWRFVRC